MYFPKTRFTPTLIAPDTYVIHDHEGEGTDPVAVPLNTMVIRGEQPVVVDTGMAENREQYLADLFSIVEPDDVRWVFISHDDIDHTGNVNEVMDACKNATLIINWFMTKRMGESLQVPFTRQRWIGDGESFDAGDRVLHAIRPPVYDSPTTRGLFDPTTGVYWASDSFATPMLQPMTHIESIDRGFWEQGFAMFAKYVSPWTDMVEDAKFTETVRRIEQLDITAIAGCHTPTIGADHIAPAFELMHTFRSQAVAPEPDQAVLDQIIAAITGVPTAA
ncbi:MAG: putative flavodoxin [Ilumatobacteraceae bacterium]|nr:putative flavodoxin [Ilumatobacteraceae bacterium]